MAEPTVQQIRDLLTGSPSSLFLERHIVWLCDRVEALEAEGSAARVIGADYMRRAVAAEARVAELEAEAAELANKAAFVLTANQELLDWNQKRRVAAEARVAELTEANKRALAGAAAHHLYGSYQQRTGKQQKEIERITAEPQPWLGLATTRQLLAEIKVRGETEDRYREEGDAMAIGAANLLDTLPGSMLDYKTVSDE